MPIVFAGYVGIHIFIPAPDHSQTLYRLHLERHLDQRFQPLRGGAVQLHDHHFWSESRHLVHSGLAGPVTGVKALGVVGVKQRRFALDPPESLKLMQGPQLLTVPAFETGRYWIVPLSDSYLNFYTAIGSHFNSTAGQYLVVGPGKHLQRAGCYLSILPYLLQTFGCAKVALIIPFGPLFQYAFMVSAACRMCLSESMCRLSSTGFAFVCLP